MYVLRTDKKSFFLHINNVCSILNYIERLNIVFTDLTTFADDSFEKYSEALLTLSKRIEDIYISGKTVQLNLLTDRMMLTKMKLVGTVTNVCDMVGNEILKLYSVALYNSVLSKRY